MIYKQNNEVRMSRSNVLPIAAIANNGLVFESNNDLEKALRIGALYIKYHEKIDLKEIQRFAENFYKENDNTGYTGYKDKEYVGSILGYEDRPEQVEQIQLEKSL